MCRRYRSHRVFTTRPTASIETLFQYIELLYFIVNPTRCTKVAIPWWRQAGAVSAHYNANKSSPDQRPVRSQNQINRLETSKQQRTDPLIAGQNSAIKLTEFTRFHQIVTNGDSPRVPVLQGLIFAPQWLICALQWLIFVMHCFFCALQWLICVLKWLF